MTKHIYEDHCYESYEYHGNTVVERTRKRGARIFQRDWLVFDSAEEAADFFYSRC